MKMNRKWLKRAAMLSVTVAFAAAGLGANAATSLTLNDGDTLTGVYEDYEITIASGATVTFNNATVTRASDNAAVVQTLGDATIILAEGSENSVAHTQTSGYGGAGISPAVGHTLTIDGTGSLTVQGGWGAAGIGVNANSVSSCGNIVIAGGTIVATGGEGGSGIGAGYYYSRCGDITITGGNVTAQALANTDSYYPPAIGAGTGNSSCGNILICGGTVTADASDPNDYSYDMGPAIGASASNCGSITIVDGVERIVATKGAKAQEIIGKGCSDYTSVGKISRLLRFNKEYSNNDNTLTLTPGSDFETYTVTWKNDDGTTADTTSVEYGLLPSHAGLTKAGDGYIEYLFAGWTPEFAEVESNVTYTAVFCAVPAVRSTGGAAEWFPDAGERALRSGAIEGNQNTWLQTTLSRPCVLSFKWKTSSEANCDPLVFYVDGVEHSRISGESADWSVVTLSFEDSKNHILRWVYSKDGGVNGKYDCGWIRDFVVTPLDSWAVTRELNYEGAAEIETRYVKKGRQLDVSEFPPLDGLRDGYTCYWALAPWSGDALTNAVDISADTTLYARWIKQHGFDEIDTTCQEPWTWLEDGSIRTGKIGDSGNTWATISVTGPCDVSFKWKSSSENGWDKLHFYVDADHKTDISGAQADWATYSASVDSGEHVLKWTYTKDGNGSVGEDCGWIKDVVITAPDSAPYTVMWKNADGTTLETDADLEAGAVPVYNSALPTLAATAQYTYEFAGWEPEFELVSSNTTYTAKYTATLRSYDVTWQNEGGTELATETLCYGTTPTYSGATPVKPATPKFTYTFAGWDPEVATVTGEATYTATYDATINEYTITWKNEDGTTLDSESVEYDETPTHADPAKASTAQYHYEFAGWSPAVVSVTGEATYTATFTPILRSYTITWLNEDGTALDTSTVEYGATPSHAAPTKVSTAQYDYTFAGWGNVVAVSGEATYQATFTPVLRSYTVSWVVEGETVASGLVAYGTTPAYSGVTPTKAEDAEYTYTFAGWSPTVSTVTGEATYTAQFNSTKRSYTITWANIDGAGASATSTVEYGTTPTYSGATPTKAETAEYTYTFAGWDKTVVAVTGAATYTATFNATKRSYTITWLNEGGAVLASGDVEYGTVPAYGGATPTKAETAEYTYTFAGWDKTVVAVTGAATYTATFNATKRSYTITWLNEGGAVLASGDVEYGTVPAYGGATPTKADDAEYTYTFAGWTPAVVAVTGAATYTATFDATPKEPEDEFAGYIKIGDVAGFETIADNLATNYVLTADIDLQNVERQPFGEFSGILDGNGHAIRNINIKGGASNERGTGLFQALNNGAIVRNLTLENGTVESLNTTEDATGGIAGHVYNSVTIENCTVDLNVKGYQYVGGIVGYARFYGSFTISRCRSFADVAGAYRYVGGLLGNAFQMDVLIEDSYSCGMVTADDNYAGGLVGYKYQGTLTIRNCFQKSVVEPNANNDRKFVGNGDSNATITGNPTVIDSLPKGGVRIAVVENGGTGTATYVNGELVATPGEGSMLERWIGEVPSGEFNDVKVWAVFCEAVEETYTVTWKNDDGTTLETDVGVAYGATPSYDGETPTKAATAQYSYTFAGWTPAPAAVVSNTTYTAQFSETVNNYTVTWVVDGASTSETLAYGAMPTHAEPTKEATAQYTYTFTGWSPAITTVTGEATYTAQFEATKRSYTVSWVVEGATVASGTVEYGTTPTYGGDTPTKESTAEYSYAFSGWSPTVSAVTGEATYTAQFEATKRSYTVSWVVEGATVASGTVEYGTTPTYGGETPTKPETAEYTYTFNGWTPAIAAVTDDATYTAQFSQTKRSYTVSWVVEGATVASGAVEYGQTPEFVGETPTKESTAEYSYEFTGWSPAVSAVTGAATYTAQFEATKRSYTVAWVVEGVTVAAGTVEYGTTPTYSGDTPTKESTAEYTYEFTGWSPTVATVTGAATYTAQFNATKRSYTVSWVVEGETVASGSVEYGTTPVYNGATPTKPEDENYTYTFNGWTPAVVAVIGNATYTATFTATPKEPDDPDEPYEGTETINGITWSYTVANGEATITGAQFAEGAIAIPETVHDGVPVMAIEEGVFADNQDITEVTISRYVRRIGADVGVKSADWAQNLEEAGFDGSYPAFGNCESLLNYRVDANNEVFEEIGGALYYRDTPASAKELALYPSGRSTLYFADGLTVTKIGDGACAWCHKFTELTIPASVREIGVRSFDFCREIVTLTIPATVTDIGWGAFLMNIALENADINGTDLAIGDYAFYHSFMADNAGNLVIRGGVKDVGFNAFCHSMHLGAVVMEDGVTNIAMNAFSQCYDLSMVTLPDTLTAIGAGAFCGCSELREIIVPLSVDEIGLSQQDDGSDGGTFAGCSALARIYLPLSLKPATVEETNAYLANVFEGLGLEDMSAAEIAEILTWYSDTSEIGGDDEPGEPYDGTETIDGVTWSFSVSNGVATITDVGSVTGDVVIPATVTNGVPVTALKDYIENLRYDDGITSITLPASVTNIGAGNFVGCTALGAINVAEGNASYSSTDGILYNAGQTELLVSPGGKTVVTNMPESVVEIASGAFEGSRVQFCMMAQYATNIAERAFSGCSYLSTATIGKHIRNIGAYAFENCGNIRVVNFASDSECEVIGVGAFSGCEKLQKVTIPDSVIVIRGGAFSGCSELFDVTIGSNVVQIGDATVPHYIDEWGDDATMDFDPAFGNCANLRDFKVSKDNAIYEAIDGCIYYRSTPNTAKTLAVYPSGRGDLHFYGGVTVTAIGEGACSYCNKLKKLTIPQSVKDIGIEAFAHCEGVTNVYIQANSVTNISFGAFAWNMNTMDVEVSGSVKTIGEWAFMHNFGPYNLNDDFTTGQLVLHEGIREIGRGAFERCFRIGEIEIPRSVERMGESAFADTRLARRIVIGNGLRVIPESAFECSWGSKLSELIIGNNVVGIGAWAFSGCEKLRNLNIPSAVWDIGDNAFSGCTSLCALNLPSNLKSIGAGAFGGSSYGMMMSSGRRLLGSGAQTFDGCTDLRRVLVPNSVTNIGVGAFGAVTSENIDRIYLPSSLKSADDSDTLAFLADQFPGLNLGIGDVTWYDDESELNYVTVTFDPNNGGETWSEQVLDYLDALPVPLTNGYAFAGWWTTSDDSGEKITMSRHFSTDTTLYAHWIETSVTFGEDAPWTAVYDDYYGEWVLQSGDVAFGHTSSASMTVTGPCIVGFDFMNCMDEWGTSNDLMILVDGDEVDCRGIFDWTERTVEIAEVGEHVVTWSYVNLNGSFNDYARLRNFRATPAVAHTVTFNLEGGTMAEAKSRQVLRSLGALPIPVKAGYIFNGWWWTDGDGFAERVSTDFAVEDDVELVARWEKSPFSAVGGDASWFLDENGDYRTEAIGKDTTVWAELRFKGPANISFDYKASMSWMSDDHFEFVVDGERALYQGGISSWRSHSEAFSDDAEHVVRWVVRRNDYGEEDYEAENCAWLTRLNLPEAITAAETPPVEVDDTKMEEPVDNGDGTRTIAAKEGETLTQSDVASVTVASPVDPAIDITAAYTKTLVDNTIVLQLAVPALEDVPEVEDDDEDPSGMLDDVDDIDVSKIAAMPEPDVSDPDPEKREEVGALPIKMYPGLYYQASWGDDLNNLTPGAKFRADGSQTHIGVIKQTGSRGFYKISVSEK